MALVRDPITGQLVDDGRPLPPGIAPTADQTRAQNEARMRQNAAEFRTSLSNLPNQLTAAAVTPFVTAAGVASGAIPLAYTSAREGRGDLQPTYAERLANYQSNQPSPLGAAEAQRVVGLATQAGVDYRNQMQAQARPPVSLLAMQQSAAQGAQSSAPGGSDARDYDAEVAAAVQPAAALSADQQPQRGNYTQYNTNLDALRQRALPTAGIDLGAAALAAERAAAPAAPRGLTVIGTGNNLRNLLTSESADERLAARVLLRDARERDIAAGQVNADLERARMAGQFGLQDTGLRGQFGLQERELANVAQVEAARQQGLASLAAAEARAAGTVQAAQLRSQGQAGAEAVNQANLALARQLYREGADPATVSAALNGTLRPQALPRPQIVNGAFGPLGVLDPATGQIRDFTQEERTALQGNANLTLPQSQ